MCIIVIVFTVASDFSREWKDLKIKCWQTPNAFYIPLVINRKSFLPLFITTRATLKLSFIQLVSNALLSRKLRSCMKILFYNPEYVQKDFTNRSYISYDSFVCFMNLKQRYVWFKSSLIHISFYVAFPRKIYDYLVSVITRLLNPVFALCN